MFIIDDRGKLIEGQPLTEEEASIYKELIEHWRGSVEGDTGYRAVFIPVYRSKKYYLPFNRRNPIKNEALRDAFTLRDDDWKSRRRPVRKIDRKIVLHLMTGPALLILALLFLYWHFK